MASQSGLIALGRSDVVSPELVLVDQLLAELSRSRLPEPDDTLARVDALIQTSRMASLARRSMEVPRGPSADRVESTRHIARRPARRRSAAFAGGLAAGTLVVALLVGVRVDLGGTPAGADSVVVEEVPAPPVSSAPLVPVEKTRKPVEKTRKPVDKPRNADRRPRTTKSSPQRFAWAPSPGASGYHIELFRRSSKVFEADTTSPALTIPARWVFEQKRQTLQPGSYRWYVWPLTSGTRAARAVVQAKLTVPPR